MYFSNQDRKGVTAGQFTLLTQIPHKEETLATLLGRSYSKLLSLHDKITFTFLVCENCDVNESFNYIQHKHLCK